MIHNSLVLAIRNPWDCGKTIANAGKVFQRINSYLVTTTPITQQRRVKPSIFFKSFIKKNKITNTWPCQSFFLHARAIAELSTKFFASFRYCLMKPITLCIVSILASYSGSKVSTCFRDRLWHPLYRRRTSESGNTARRRRSTAMCGGRNTP